LTGEFFFGGGAETPSSAWSNFFRLIFGQRTKFGDGGQIRRLRAGVYLLPMKAKFGVLEQTHGIRLRAKFHIDWFILSLPSSKNTTFCCFFTARASSHCKRCIRFSYSNSVRPSVRHTPVLCQNYGT